MSNRNESYVPYQVNGEWWFDQPHGKRGPFLSEEAAVERAEALREGAEHELDEESS